MGFVELGLGWVRLGNLGDGKGELGFSEGER